MAELPQAEIGIFGGSGFYSLFEGDYEEVSLDTRWGQPSDVYTVGTIGGRKVAFLPRHGHKHTFAPGEVNYRANLWGMHELGVKQVIGPCSVGSLSLDIHPGDFVICDQFVDRTKGSRRRSLPTTLAWACSTSPLRTPTARPCARLPSKSAASWAFRARRRHRGHHPGAALLDHRRERVVPEDGLVGGEHDAVPRAWLARGWACTT